MKWASGEEGTDGVTPIIIIISVCLNHKTKHSSCNQALRTVGRCPKLEVLHLHEAHNNVRN